MDNTFQKAVWFHVEDADGKVLVTKLTEQQASDRVAELEDSHPGVKAVKSSLTVTVSTDE